MVQAQSGGVDDVQAQRHLDLGRIYEQAGEWDLALEEYGIAAQAESDNLAAEARGRINQVLLHKHSFWDQVRDDVQRFWVWATSNSIKLVISAVAVVLLGKFLLRLATGSVSWTVMPFLDLTKNDLGEAVSESIVGLIHEARLIHLNASTGALSVSEEVDLPSFRSPSHKKALLSSLKALDSLDVSGISLPMGSALAAVVRWLDMGQYHILGTIQQRGNSLCLSAQLRKGRGSGSSRVWTVCSSVDRDDPGSTLFALVRDLVFQVLFDTQDGWGASTSKSLDLFTEALRKLQLFQAYPTMQEKALQDSASSLSE